LPPGLLDDDPARSMLIPRLHHHQSIMTRSPNDGLYNNLYDKDVGLMRKLMNMDEFQCPGNVSHNNSASNDMNASKQFHQYSNGTFNGKFANSTGFPFPFDNKQQVATANGIRHEGLLKPCYEFATKTETLDDGFGSAPISSAAFKKQQQQLQQQQQASLYTSSGFMNQFQHEALFGANSHHSTFASKLNEINNNNGGGIVVKMENGVSADFNTLHASQVGKQASELLCPRTSATMSKTEPNEFRNSNCKATADDEEHKSSALRDDSNDGFTQL
jgi:hypothetical protein